MAAIATAAVPSASDAMIVSQLEGSSDSTDAALTPSAAPCASAGEGAGDVASAASSYSAQPLLLAPAKAGLGSESSGEFPFTQTGRGAATRSAAARQATGRQTSITSRGYGMRTKSMRSSSVASAVDHQRDATETNADSGETPRNSRCSIISSHPPAFNSGISPSSRGRSLKVSSRSAGEAAGAATPAASEDSTGNRGIRHLAAHASAAGAVCATTQAISAATATEEAAATASATPTAALDYRGLRRSLRQALLANSVKAQTPGPGGNCSTGSEVALGGTAAVAAGSAPGVMTAGTGGGIGAAGPANSAAGGRRRMRQPHRQLLQSYVVGQHHRQAGPQADERTTCLAEWLDINSSTPCCCCGASCVSCTANCNGTASSSGSSAQGSLGCATRSTGGGMRSVLEVYATAAARRDRQQRQQQQRAGSPVVAAQQKRKGLWDGISVCPSWFESSVEAEFPPSLCRIRPASPSRSAIFASQQAAWEAEDMRDSAETAATTAGTPWPKGSTSCSFGGYGAATRSGGLVPLCCYCGLPLRPPAVSSLRAGNTESGCPLAAAAAAAASLGLDGWTQWCRCCTRVYGDLRLQHQRNATGLPFASFTLPKGQLRYLLLPADGAKDAPGGLGSVASAIAAAAVADPRRIKLIDDSVAMAADADADMVAANAGPNPNGSNGSLGSAASLRRTRSGHYFIRPPASRSSSRSNNLLDIVRFLGASCCWPSNTSGRSYVQPLARLQQKLTQLQQQHADHTQQQQHQPQQHRRLGAFVERAAASTELKQTAGADVTWAACTGFDTAAASPETVAVSLAGATPAAPAAKGTAAAGAGVTPSVVGHSHDSQAQASADSGEDNETSVDLADADLPRAAAATAVGAAVQQFTATSTPRTLESEPQDCFDACQYLQAARETQAKGNSSAMTVCTVVVPRVYMESNSGCYVATAFDSVRQQLLQKRFSCAILGEQRAHALACQWLRWVCRGIAKAVRKSRLPDMQPHTASGVHGVPATAAAMPQIESAYVDGLATATAPAASLGSTGTASGSWGVGRGPQAVESGGIPQNQEQAHLRNGRQPKRRRRYGEFLVSSDPDEVQHLPIGPVAASVDQGQQMQQA
ncbi:hypothetical protein, conserved [Eimeria tenella]|uniref:Uncharacterized protein n=1 Tax=Eimeria tenella TaxID=5802 RepID=U6L400_EIMTE|nr:hypothetical protein, conserved [Eimeria tenella]CDJ42470.1 hypothetical protein, conserved [Eimeria tenella]|eukprot:XP_013233220.1 hypothetical protein, conserved [Eimeria tenella]